MADFSHHEPCPDCGSRDNLARYDDGSVFCFGCSRHEKGDGAIFVAVLKEQIIILGQQLGTARAKAEEDNKIVVAALAAADAYDGISEELQAYAGQFENLKCALEALSYATIGFRDRFRDRFRDLPSAEVEE